MRGQKGQTLAFTLMLLSLGSLAIIPNLSYLYTVVVGQRIMEEYIDQQYAADAALEDAFWQIMNDNLLDNLDYENEIYSYDYDFQPDFFDGDIPVTIEYAEAPPSDWVISSFWFFDLAAMRAEVEPAWIEQASGSPQTFTYTIFADNISSWWFLDYELSFAGAVLPGSLEYVEGSAEHLLPADYNLDDPDSWPAFSAHYDPEVQYTDMDLWEDGDPTWTQIEDTSPAPVNIASNGTVTLSGTPGAPYQTTHTYNFVGVDTSNDGENGNPIAIEHDSDSFPWTSSGARNDSANPNDTEYGNISADNTSQWATDDPGWGDEMAVTYRFFIEEWVDSNDTVEEIEITWNGNTDDANGVDHKIYLRKDGFDEFGGSNTWVQLGGTTSINQDVDTDVIRTLDTDFGTYINDTTGQFEFVVTHDRSSSDMRTNYVQVEVTYTTQDMVYDTPGSLTSDPITVVDLDQWHQFTYDADQPANTTVTFQLEYWDGDSWEVIPDGDLSGNPARFAYDASPIDLTGLNVGTYDQLRINAQLSTTDTSVTPEIDDWQITAIDADSKRELVWEYGDAPLTNVEIDGGETYILRFEAEGNPNWGLHYAEPWISTRGEDDRLASGPSGPVSVAMYHVTIVAGEKTLKAVVVYTESEEVKIASYQVYN